MKPAKLELELAKNKRFWSAAGVDEVAACCYAGPLYAGALILGYKLKHSDFIANRGVRI